MSLEVYSPDFSTRREISHAISIMLSVYYRDIGKMTIVMPIDDYNIATLQKNSVVYDTARKRPYVIANVKVDTELNRITANGFTSEWLLNKRAVIEKSTVDNVEIGAYSAVNANLRGLTRIRTAPVSGLPDSLDGYELYGKQLLDGVDDALAEVEMGRRMDWDEAKNEHVFTVYKGVDRTEGIHAVVFSEEQGTAKELTINDDDSTYKNVAYITAEYRDETTELISVGQAEGDDRREIFSTRTIRQMPDESEEDVQKRAKAEAALELARNLQRKNFSVTIDPEELGEKYDLGDVVACVSIRFGVQFTARVTGVKYTLDLRGEKTEVILGTPNITAIGGLTLGRY